MFVRGDFPADDVDEEPASRRAVSETVMRSPLETTSTSRFRIG